MPKTVTTCCVCFEKFNQTIRCPTTCPHCSIQICRSCFQTYLLNETTDTPRCVNVECDRGWERNFLDGEMTQNFRLKTYKEHREKVLADREKARLPGTQSDAVALIAAREEKPVQVEKLQDLEKQISQLARQRDTVETRLRHINTVISSFGRHRMPEDPNNTNISTATAVAKTPVAAFIKPCPAPDCKGFLSTAWKCGLCSLYTCSDCHMLKGPQRDDPNHHCNPDDVATATLINREAKSCPKCGVSICKIEGCDQMWCTNCNTGFNWRTGKEILNNAIHNPHYFEWLRSHGRTAADAQGPHMCAVNDDRRIIFAIYGQRYPPYHSRRDIGAMAEEDLTKLYIAEAYRIGREMDDLNRNDDTNTENMLRIFRVRYMTGDLTEEEWKASLQRSEKDMRVRTAKTHISQLFSGGVQEIMQQILQEGHNKTTIKNQIDELVKYCNKCFEDISKQFNRKFKPIDVLERYRPPPPPRQPATATATATATTTATATATANTLI